MSSIHPRYEPICVARQWKQAAPYLFGDHPRILEIVEQFTSLGREQEFYPGVLYSSDPPAYFKIESRCIEAAARVFHETQKFDPKNIPEELHTLAAKISLSLVSYDQIILNIPIRESLSRHLDHLQHERKYHSHFQIPHTQEGVTSYAVNMHKQAAQQEKKERWHFKKR